MAMSLREKVAVINSLYSWLRQFRLYDKILPGAKDYLEPIILELRNFRVIVKKNTHLEEQESIEVLRNRLLELGKRLEYMVAEKQPAELNDSNRKKLISIIKEIKRWLPSVLLMINDLRQKKAAPRTRTARRGVSI